MPRPTTQRIPSAAPAAPLTILLLAAVAGGCQSGGSRTGKPSWWTFGGGNSAALADAPPAEDDVTKPSATAKPYPVTTTPQGYAIDAAGAAGQSPAMVSATAQPAEDPAVVTYGTRPPVTPASPASAGPPAPPAAAAAGLAGIAPQVGAYAAAPGPAPPEQTLPASPPGGFAGAMPAPGSQPSAYAAPPVPAAGEQGGIRVADARAADGWAAATPAPAGDSRYASSTGSRFSGVAPPAAVQAADLVEPRAPSRPAPVATPAAAPYPVPPASEPQPPFGPAAAPAVAPPPTPTRRPDPGYRPFGTSNYKPSRTILAGEPSEERGGVRPASFTAAAAAP